MKRKTAKSIRKKVSKKSKTFLTKELDGIVKEMFDAWQKEHPDVKVSSSTIKDPIAFMLIAMAGYPIAEKA